VNLQVLIVIVVLGGGMIGAGALLVKGQIDMRVAAEVAATAERTRADLAERQVDRLEMAVENQQERQAILTDALQAARDREEESTDVLEDRARLENLTQAKPGLLERLARTATTKVWREIEADSREP